MDVNNTKTLFKERKLLKKINASFSDSDKKYVSFKSLNISKDDYYLQLLHKKNLIASIHKAINPDNLLDHRAIIIGIRPTTEGLHFFEWRKEELNSFLIKSVYIPIAVSISTTCLIWLAKWLIGLAMH